MIRVIIAGKLCPGLNLVRVCKLDMCQRFDYQQPLVDADTLLFVQDKRKFTRLIDTKMGGKDRKGSYLCGL